MQCLKLDTVLQGDCRRTLPGLPERSVDLIFADPPYNLQSRNRLWRPNGSPVSPVHEPWDRFKDFAAYDAFTREWLTACHRVLKDSGTVWVSGTYHNIYRVGAVLQDLGFWILNDIVWCKRNPMPHFSGRRFCNAHETLIWSKKSDADCRYTFNYKALKAANDDRQMRSDWHLSLCTGRERLKLEGAKSHPTQKPEALLYRILIACTKPGDVVLDPFFGTGTTGAVAKRLGRHWIGIEQESRYVQLARRRIAPIKPTLLPEHLPAPLDAPHPTILFLSLLEYHLLKPGCELRLMETQHRACVLDDGTIACHGLRGSIHRVGAQLLQRPMCNGWLAWYFLERRSGDWKPIDRLRARLRERDRTAVLAA